ncbi:hypothetical protein H5407_01095 [Mitsuaria sp. WAJ17]|uniref:hypothetical protein n=1 Tax=Mitsuaria sp. WAJ17 TaxID=2761452 RepID=UPI001601F74E|nr:hypothetical protein [Mitsuaria sp. WAJ17]MBB2483815.1 hypothetical protein [Mitsuaria sp. WAJ17]
MHLDLNNPRSIVSWWQVYPERHGPQLSALARLQPQFAASIREARRLIDDDPLLAERHAAARRQQALARGWVPSAEDRELDQVADSQSLDEEGARLAPPGAEEPAAAGAWH